MDTTTEAERYPFEDRDSPPPYEVRDSRQAPKTEQSFTNTTICDNSGNNAQQVQASGNVSPLTYKFHAIQDTQPTKYANPKTSACKIVCLSFELLCDHELRMNRFLSGKTGYYGGRFLQRL